MIDPDVTHVTAQTHCYSLPCSLRAEQQQLSKDRANGGTTTAQ